MTISRRIELFTRVGVLGLALALGVVPDAEPQGSPTPITIGPEIVILPQGARTALGFQFGPVDGVMGASHSR